MFSLNYSKSSTSTTVLNEFVTSVTNSVLNDFRSSTSTGQFINVSCDKEVAIKCRDLCAADISQYRADQVKLVSSSEELEQRVNNYVSAVCNCCTASNLNQNLMLNITTQAISDNTISNQIKTTMVNKLNQELEEINDGVIGGVTANYRNAVTNIRTKVENSFSNDIVNSTLNEFHFNQDITAHNESISDTSQTTVATILSTNITKNLLTNDATLDADLQTIIKEKTSNIGIAKDLLDTASGMFKTFMSGATMIYAVIAVVVVVLGVALIKFGPVSWRHSPAPARQWRPWPCR